jgi:hypothetical protein
MGFIGRLFTFFPQKHNSVGLSKEQCGYPMRKEPFFALPKLKSEEAYVFSFDGRVCSSLGSVDFPEAYADQNFAVFLQNGEPGAPSLVFRQQIHAKRILPTAKLRGSIFRIAKEKLELLDTVFQNGVSSHRRMTRVLLPFQKENGVMVNTPAWMYQDIPSIWKDKFNYDTEMFRVRGEGQFIPALLDYNPKFPHIEKYYIHPNNKLASTLPQVS